MSIYPKVQVLWSIYFAMIVGVGLFALNFIDFKNLSKYGSVDISNLNIIFFILLFISLIAYLINRFVVKPRLQKLDPNLDLDDKINYLNSTMVIYMAPWEALCLLSIFAIKLSDSYLPLGFLLLGFIMMILVFPNLAKLKKYGKLTAEQLQKLQTK